MMASEDGSVFDVGPASGPRPKVGPTTEGEPASTGGPQEEFHVTDRISLLNTLKDALKGDVPSTIWACLWLSDIDKLKELVDRVKRDPYPWLGSFKSIEFEAKIVQICNSRLLCSYNTGLLILYRVPTSSPAFYYFNSSATIYSPGSTFPNSTTYLTATVQPATIQPTAIISSTVTINPTEWTSS